MDSYGELIGDLPFVPNTTDANKHDEALLFRHKIVQEAICECACPCTYMPLELIVIEGEVTSYPALSKPRWNPPIPENRSRWLIFIIPVYYSLHNSRKTRCLRPLYPPHIVGIL
jgi:hypothetical protein